MDYKRPLTNDKALSQAKRETRREHCGEIEKAQQRARLHRILSMGGWGAVSSIQFENGQYSISEKETLEQLFPVHFPGSKIILEPSGAWNGLELEFLKWRGTTGHFAATKSVITYDRFIWDLFSFQPHKSPGIDGIVTITIQ
jgi:hypothetical protein